MSGDSDTSTLCLYNTSKKRKEIHFLKSEKANIDHEILYTNEETAEKMFLETLLKLVEMFLGHFYQQGQFPFFPTSLVSRKGCIHVHNPCA